MVKEREGISFVGATHPLKTELVETKMPSGLTILQMLEEAGVDDKIAKDAVVYIDDWEIPRDMWHVVRPSIGRSVTARILPVPRGGGGGGGGKNPLRTILTIAVIAVAAWAGPALASAYTGLAAGSAAAAASTTFTVVSAIGTAAVATAGMMLVNAIAPVKPPKMPNLSGGAGASQESPSLFVEGARNGKRLFDVVPSVLGYYRMTPPLGAESVSEVLGDSNNIRSLFVVGYGELELSDWRIGETPIENYSDYELEVRTGSSIDNDPLTIYPDQVSQEEFSIKISQEAGWQSRTGALNADEIGVDLAFPQGLVRFTDGGARSSASMTIEIEYREVGSGTWLPVPDTFESTFDASWKSGSSITFTHARSVALRHGISWKVPTRGQYEVQIRRTTADTNSTQLYDTMFWGVLRSVTDEDPIAFSKNLAKAALKIRSTDQLNGVVDELSVLAKSVCLDWDSGTQTWVERATNNPASLFRHVLQGPAKAVPVTDDFVDLDKLQEWHEFCESKGFTFNQVRDFSSSITDVLSDICVAGRAGLDMNDGKWSVVIDQPQSITVSHITPRNSSGFEAEKAFLETPHAWRIRFPNENEDYTQDERVVYLDGYDETNATLFESIEFPGVTNPDHIWKLGRFHGAQVVQRPERWSVTMDYESIIAKRGSRVKVSHDIMLVGLGSGRIKSLTTDGSGNVLTITTDEEFSMEAGKSYGLSVRRDVTGDVSLSVAVDLSVGDGITTFTCSTPIPVANAPEVDDLLSFGEFGQEAEDALVLINQPENDLAARITLIPYREVVYDADSGTVPTYTPNITPIATIPVAEINSVISDESALARGAGESTLVRAEIEVQPVSDPLVSLKVQQRITGSGESWYDAEYSMRTKSVAVVSDVQQGEVYDFRVKWHDGERLSAPWTEYPNHTIVGKSTPPDPLSGLTVSAFGGQALLRWDEPSELDVRFGGSVRFRHSAVASPTWAESTSIGDAAQARGLFATLPLKPGTYLARVFDSDGNPSDSVTTVTTKQASVLEYANVDTLDEAPLFVGTHSNTTSSDGELKLAGTGLVDSIADWDSMSNFDSYGGVELSGTYDFSQGFDLTTVKRVRLTTRVTAMSVNVNDLIDERTGLMDDWEDFDGTLQAQADLQVWVRHTDDDPAGSPTWSDWERLDSAEFEARGFDFQARLSTEDSSFNIVATELGIDVEELV